MRRPLFNAVRILLSAAILFLLLRKLQIGSPSAILLNAKSGVAVTIVPVMISWYLAGLKWRFVQPVTRRLTVQQSIKNTLIGLTYGYLLPGGQLMGEIGKYMHTRLDMVRREGLAASIILDKIIGFVALTLVGAVGALADAQAPVFVRNISVSLTIAGLFYILTMTGLPLRKAIRAGAASLFSFLRIKKMSALYDTMFPEYPRPHDILSCFGVSIVYQLTIGGIVYLLAQNVSVALPVTRLLWIWGIVGIVQSLPISYGGLGVRELSFVFLLSLYGVTGSSALSLSLNIYLLLLIGACIGTILIVIDVLKKRNGYRRVKT